MQLLIELRASYALPPQGLQLAALAQLGKARLTLQGEISAASAAALAAQLERLPCQTELRLTDTALSGVGALQVVRCAALLSRLTMLQLVRIGLSYASVAALAACFAPLSRLRELSLAGGALPSNSATTTARALSAISVLTRMDVSGDEALRDAGIAAMLKACNSATQLRALNLRNPGKQRLNMAWVRKRCCLQAKEALIS